VAIKDYCELSACRAVYPLDEESRKYMLRLIRACQIVREALERIANETICLRSDDDICSNVYISMEYYCAPCYARHVLGGE